MTTTEKRYWEDLNWATDHHSELLPKYANEWVAIYQKKVVAHGTSGEAVENEAERKTGKPEREIPVYYVESGSNIYAG